MASDESKSHPHNLRYAIFEIDAKPNLKADQTSYADISGFSEFEEKEIIFQAGSVFQLESISLYVEDPRVSLIRMTLCNDDDEQMKKLLAIKKKKCMENSMNKPIDESTKPSLITLAVVLIEMGYLSQAKKLLERTLKALGNDSDSVEAGLCYRYLGDVSRYKNGFIKNQTEYQKALSIFRRCFNSSDHRFIAATYLCLGHSCCKINDWGFASWYQMDLKGRF